MHVPLKRSTRVSKVSNLAEVADSPRDPVDFLTGKGLWAIVHNSRREAIGNPGRGVSQRKE